MDRWLRRWDSQPGGKAWARGLGWRLVFAAAVAVAAAYADYMIARAAGGPVAGRATATARPAD